MTLASSPELSHLLSLDLWECEIGDAGALALAASPHLSELHHLQMVFNEEVTRIGCRAFDQANMPHLISLWLPDAESEAEIEERERLLREHFAPHIDLGETDVKERGDNDDEEEE